MELFSDRLISGPYFPDWDIHIFPYLVRMRENMDQKNSEYGHFTQSHLPISEQCSQFTLPENTEKFLVFWCFQGV